MNTERAAGHRRSENDDQWLNPHDLYLAMFSPSTVHVLPFDPPLSDSARQYAGKYASMPEKWYFGDYRVGIGISHTVGTLIDGIAQLNEPTMEKLINEELLGKAIREGELLMPYLRPLNAGKGSNQADQTAIRFTAKKRLHDNRRAASFEEIEQTVQTLHAWLSQPDSSLRGILAILGGNGVFFAAHVAEKTARSWIKVNNESQKQFMDAVVVRMHLTPDDEVATQFVDDTHGLFK